MNPPFCQTHRSFLPHRLLIPCQRHHSLSPLARRVLVSHQLDTRFVNCILFPRLATDSSIFPISNFESQVPVQVDSALTSSITNHATFKLTPQHSHKALFLSFAPPRHCLDFPTPPTSHRCHFQANSTGYFSHFPKSTLYTTQHSKSPRSSFCLIRPSPVLSRFQSSLYPSASTTHCNIGNPIPPGLAVYQVSTPFDYQIDSCKSLLRYNSSTDLQAIANRQSSQHCRARFFKIFLGNALLEFLVVQSSQSSLWPIVSRTISSTAVLL